MYSNIMPNNMLVKILKAGILKYLIGDYFMNNK